LKKTLEEMPIGISMKILEGMQKEIRDETWAPNWMGLGTLNWRPMEMPMKISNRVPMEALNEIPEKVD
jgi:hypothetical protein